jgi:hypothetical protein
VPVEDRAEQFVDGHARDVQTGFVDGQQRRGGDDEGALEVLGVHVGGRR